MQLYASTTTQNPTLARSAASCREHTRSHFEWFVRPTPPPTQSDPCPACPAQTAHTNKTRSVVVHRDTLPLSWKALPAAYLSLCTVGWYGPLGSQHGDECCTRAISPAFPSPPTPRITPLSLHTRSCREARLHKRSNLSLSLRVSLSGSVSGSVLRSSGEIHRSLTCVEAQHLQLLEEGQLRRHHRHRGHRKAKLHQPARLEILQLVEIVD